jgi:ABC-2 type transport system ATP-binding protein
VREHLEFFRDLYSISESVYAQKKEELLHITRLGDFEDRKAGKLSGGMYKKLGLACVLLHSPKVLLLDETTNGVDPISRRELWDLLHRLATEKITVLVTTSYMDEAERCSRVHLMESGRQILSGDPREILNRENAENFEEVFLKRTGTHTGAIS